MAIGLLTRMTSKNQKRHLFRIFGDEKANMPGSAIARHTLFGAHTGWLSCRTCPGTSSAGSATLVPFGAHTLRDSHHLNVPTPKQVPISSFLVNFDFLPPAQWLKALLHMFLRLFQILDASWYRRFANKTFDTEPTATHTAALLVQEAQKVWIYHRTGCLLTGSHPCRLPNEPACNFDIDSVLSLCELNRRQKFRGIKEALFQKPLSFINDFHLQRQAAFSNEQQREILWPQQYNHVTPLHGPIALFLNHPVTTTIQPRKHNQSARLGLSKPPELQPALWLLARLPCHPQEQTVPANFLRAPQPQEGRLRVNDIHKLHRLGLATEFL